MQTLDLDDLRIRGTSRRTATADLRDGEAGRIPWERNWPPGTRPRIFTYTATGLFFLCCAHSCIWILAFSRADITVVNLAKVVVGTTRMEAVSVRGKHHTVILTKVSKDLWLADGDLDGKKIQKRGRTEYLLYPDGRCRREEKSLAPLLTNAKRLNARLKLHQLPGRCLNRQPEENPSG